MSKEGKSKSKRERWERERKKMIIPRGVLPPTIMAYMGRLRPGKGSLLRLQVYTASSPGCSGGAAGKGRRACNYVSGIWIPPPIPLWLPIDWAVRFRPISAKRKRAPILINIEKHVKARANCNDVISNVISLNQHFASTFSRQRCSNIRDVVARSPSFSCPAARAPQRACSLVNCTKE